MRYHHSIKLKDFSQQRGRITNTRVVLGEQQFFFFLANSIIAVDHFNEKIESELIPQLS
jgi:hypothetical protein